jgi:hypothetical protein
MGRGLVDKLKVGWFTRSDTLYFKKLRGKSLCD